ncbi:DEAD/DEAH box helicase [Belnapia rosea]|uniref:DEAD/DEAH box helicase n=1 Tax=Belnapia rosea TaxID=938405 RepID=UPI00115F948B|nr:ATP-binding protein [Belnapia rosea]
MRRDHDLRTLRYWRDVEALTAPSVEDEADGPEDIVRHVRHGALPWERGQRIPDPAVHFVRFGIIPRRDYDRELRGLLGAAEPEDRDDGRRARTGPLTFLGVLEVGPDLKAVEFRPDEHLAAFAVHFAELAGADVSGYHDRLSEFFEEQKRLLEERRRQSGSEDLPVGMDFVRAMAGRAASLLGAPPPVGGIVEAVVVSKALLDRKGRTRNPELPPVNGFYYDDLSAAIDAASRGAPGGLVAEYLRDGRGQGRQDCLKPEEMARALDLSRLPDGRWPSEFPLTLMQQVAVSEGLARLSDGGIFSVNGPPGTGKTTLLADVVASVVVERARLMAGFRSPADAFREVGRSMAADEGFVPDPRFRDFTVVVASSNNGAVENITRELPDAAKIAPTRRAACARFKETAAALLNRRPKGEGGDADAEPVTPREAWGLIAAALGNKANRGTFCAVLRAKEKVPPGEGGGNRPWRDAPSNVFRQLEELGRPDWAAAKADFRAALGEVRHLKDEIAEHERQTEAAARAEAEAESAGERRRAAAGGAEAARRGAAAADEDLAAAREILTAADRDVDLGRPGIVARVFAALRLSQAALAARAAHEEAVRRRAEASAALQAAVGRGREASMRRQEAEAAEAAAAADEAALVSSAEKARRAVERIARAHGGITDMASTLALPRDRMHQRLPRSSKALDAARAEVFVRALGVHQAFVGGAARQFRRNLSLALKMVGGEMRPEPSAALDLWATLAILVPVFSSTFASFGRCFATVPAGGIGWLIVDEAGQAVPQHAAGALMRAKRALVVGDPLQVEPVITLDEEVDRRLQERRGARPIHRSTATSMQVLADRNNPFGTWIAGGEEEVWVGSPLVVHRRCVEPMFSISNAIAYGGGMVLGDGKAEQEKRINEGDPALGVPPQPLLGPSRWIDMPTDRGGNGHFMPAHADLAAAIVREFRIRGWAEGARPDGLPDLFVISPFRTAADGLRRLLSSRRGWWAPGIPDKAMGTWLNACVGTVHTFQGKEAETVVLLLGGRTPGAIRWAAGTPNVLNVAVTRAKRRLYVIGDWDAWMREPRVRSTMGGVEGFRSSAEAVRASLSAPPTLVPTLPHGMAANGPRAV